MEQPKLGCDYPNIHNPPHSITSPVSMSPPQQQQRSGTNTMSIQKPQMLRRASQSSPHLDIPHFINGQEKGFNTFHHVLSGVDTTHLGIMPSSPDLSSQKAPPAPTSGLDRNKSALELSSFDPINAAGGLRKVASIANYNLTHRSDSSSGSSNTGLSSSHLSPFAHHFGHLKDSASHHSISTIPEDQGLMMSVRPASGLASAIGSTAGAARGGLMESASASMAGAGAISETQSPPRSGVFGVFGRGFFAKPVIRSDEENYRYIMALDR